MNFDRQEWAVAQNRAESVLRGRMPPAALPAPTRLATVTEQAPPPPDDWTPPASSIEYGIPLDAEPELDTVVPVSRPVLTISEWLDRALPAPDFISGDWLTTTSRVLFAAATGLGKTNFAMQLGIHVAAGADFLHWSGRRPCKVLYVDGEMSRRLLRQRIADAVERLGHSPSGFHVLSHEDIEGFPPLNTEPGQACIERIIAEIGGVDLIVFDSIMCLLAGDQKDGEPWAQVMPWARSLTKRSIGQIWLHHTGHDASRSYGDKSREWQLDTVAHAEAVENPATDVSFNLEFRKARERTPVTRADFQTATVSLIDNRWQSDSAASSSNPHARRTNRRSPRRERQCRSRNSGRLGHRSQRAWRPDRRCDAQDGQVFRLTRSKNARKYGRLAQWPFIRALVPMFAPTARRIEGSDPFDLMDARSGGCRGH